jgi:hypothetical protein
MIVQKGTKTKIQTFHLSSLLRILSRTDKGTRTTGQETLNQTTPLHILHKLKISGTFLIYIIDRRETRMNLSHFINH